jgi:hypothetical protein
MLRCLWAVLGDARNEASELPHDGGIPSRPVHGAGLRTKVKLYYAAEGAFYAASIIMLFCWEERRKDFNAMILHHVATTLLIAVSYYYSCVTCLTYLRTICSVSLPILPD